ncbi:hypothetical protein E2C01_081292 [Portunus trituberculatus]|uniref:Uncharacterized protein n=1 Tax=Portunus trituberculatus TaxID=210409 RepID=A0A5B7IVW7_PORTR|nr:hypothetical protein [Portunus trituberculatus]
MTTTPTTASLGIELSGGLVDRGGRGGRRREDCRPPDEVFTPVLARWAGQGSMAPQVPCQDGALCLAFLWKRIGPLPCPPRLSTFLHSPSSPRSHTDLIPPTLTASPPRPHEVMTLGPGFLMTSLSGSSA